MSPRQTERIHDIYGGRRENKDPMASRDSPPASNLLWEDFRRFRRSAAFLWMVILGTAVLVSAVSVYHYLKTTAPSLEKAGPTLGGVTAPADAPAPLDFSEDPRTLFLTDELKEPTAEPAEGGADRPLEVQWLKEAAYHLVQAEKAAKEARDADATRHYREALRIFPDLKGASRQLGLLYLRGKDYTNAVSAFEAAAREEVMSYGVANNLGATYLQLERYDEAETSLLHALRLKPDYAAAVFNLATLYLRRGDLTKSAAEFRRYLEMEPADLRAAQSYAYTLLQLQSWQSAAEVLSRVAEARPDSAPVQFRLAQALGESGRYEEAMQHLARGSTLMDHRHALAWLSRPEFDRLRGREDFTRLLARLSEGG